jgi:hypothetical protein
VTYDDFGMNYVGGQLTGYEKAVEGMERDLDRMIYENRDLRQQLDEEHLERVRLESQVQDLQHQVRQLEGLLRAEGMTGWEEPEPMCAGCGRHPDDISEYSPEATGEDLTPVAYVRQEEGTYNRHNGHFLCTACYIKAGQPSAPGGWTAS